MLACLVLAAAIAVITILIGKFSETTGRALGTILVALVHIAIVFGLVSLVTSRKTDAAPKSTELVVNLTIFIAVLSFFTSVLAIWQALTGDLPLKLYITYVVVLFAVIHTKTLLDIGAVYQKIKPYVLANYLFIALVSLLILGLTYAPDAGQLLSGFYGRALAASAVIDVTISIACAVMYRLYIQKHPEIVAGSPSRSHGALKIILALVAFVLVIWPLLAFLSILSAFTHL